MTRNVILSAAAAAMLMIGSAGSAAAQTWNQSSGNDYSWSGSGVLFSTVTLNCGVSGGIKTASPGTGSTTTTSSTAKPFSGGLFGLCGTVEMLNTSLSTTIGASSDGINWPVTISGLSAKTTTGGICNGNITGNFNETTQELVIGGTLNPGTTSCDVDLVLTPSPALYLAP
jgi:hypothetical protein